jgi:hypothetical protein
MKFSVHRIVTYPLPGNSLLTEKLLRLLSGNISMKNLADTEKLFAG